MLCLGNKTHIKNNGLIRRTDSFMGVISEDNFGETHSFYIVVYIFTKKKIYAVAGIVYLEYF